MKEQHMTSDRDLGKRLAAMESRVNAVAPPDLHTRRSRRTVLSLMAAPLLILAVAGTAVAGITIVNQAHGAPGVENQGQPLYGAQMECMTPPQAAAYIAAHGITKVTWQVESDAPAPVGAVKPGSRTVVQATAPQTGIVVPGAIVDGTLLMVVDQRSGAQPSGVCTGR
jgi:hypothetical protein